MALWSQDEIEDLRLSRRWLKSKRDIQGGIQFVLTDSTPVTWYTTGKVVVAGKPTPLKQQLQELLSRRWTASRSAATLPSTPIRNTWSKE